MSPEFQTVKDVFLAALERPAGAERAAYLAAACGADEALRGQVEALLRRHEQAGSFLEQPAAPPPAAGPAETGSFAPGRSAPATAGEPPPPLPGQVIGGRYKLLEEVGEGGMGTVWMAEQTEPVSRRVAVKLIKPGMDSRQVLARFEAERQALALMDHPNIAKVHDAGTTPEGRPFFVMELVKGTPITAHCDGRQVGVRERLALFADVCRAVQHAHQKGVIHRDLKPSNILVAPYDGRPVVKVIDFGVAKAMGRRLTEATLFTGFGAVVGTPEYMSPEQAEVNNQDIDTRSDIYALGVLLYELLTGSTPLTRRRLKEAALLEVLRVIREEEPPRPSLRLSSTEELPAIAARRQTEPAKLTRLVRGELDWIAMKALEKDRARRYETATGLAADIERYLAGDPVLAVPPSAGYRLRKFVRRNKGPVLAGTVVLLTLVGGVVGTSYGLVRARQARAAESRRAAAEQEAREQAQTERDAKDRALREEERERRYAQAIADFVNKDFLALTSVEGQDRFGDPGEKPLGKDATLQQVLDRAAAKLDQRKDLDPRTEADLRWMIGMSYRAQDRHDLSIPFLERCLALRTEVLGPEDKDTLNAQNTLAIALQSVGQLDRALKILEVTLGQCKKTMGVSDPYTIGQMDNLGRSYLDAGKLDQARACHDEALKLARATLPEDSDVTLRCMRSRAFVYRTEGQYGEALRLFKETLALAEKHRKPDDAKTIGSLSNLGLAYLDVRQPEEAVKVFKEAHRRAAEKWGPTADDTLRYTVNLGLGYQATGRLKEALPLFKDALEHAKPRWGLDNPETITLMNNLGLAYLDADKPQEGLRLLQEAFDRTLAVRGPTHPETLQSMNSLGLAYRDAGNPQQAIKYLQKALDLQRKHLPKGHPSTLVTMHNLAPAYYAAGSPEKAPPLVVEAAEGVERLGYRHPNAHLIINSAINCLELFKKFDEAEPWRRKWLAVVRESGAKPLDVAGELAELGMNLLRQQKWEAAEPVLRECLAIRDKDAADAWNTFNTRSMLGEALLGRKNYEEAEPLLVEGYQGMKERAASIPPQGRTRLPEAADRLVRLYEAKGNKDEAAKWRKELEDLKKAAEKTVKPKGK